MEPRRIIKFNGKVREIDRQYEMNNNAELDNGVYHQDEEVDGGHRMESKASANGGQINTPGLKEESYL